MQSETSPHEIGSLQPSLFHRWLGAVPIFMTFVIVGYVSTRAADVSEYYARWRVDLPLPTIAALFLCKAMSQYYGLALPSMFTVCWLYFGWAAKKHNRLMWFNTLAFLVCIITALFLIGGLFLPYLKIEGSLRRK